MKTIKSLLFIIIISIPMLSFGQTDEIKKLYDKYGGQDDVVYLNFNSNMLGFLNQDDNPEAKELFSKINTFSLLTLPMGRLKSGDLKEIKAMFESKDLETVMSMRDGKDNVRLVISEKDDVVNRFMLLVENDEEFVILNFNGKIPRSIWENAQGKVDFTGMNKGQK
jgi:hypothetical protein